MNRKAKKTILTMVVGILIVICCIVNPTTGQQPNSADPSKSAVRQSNNLTKEELHLLSTSSDHHHIHFNHRATTKHNDCDKKSSAKTNELKASDSTVINPVDVHSMNLVKMSSKVLEKLSFRLPRSVIPKRYDLLMHPDLKAKTFTGTVKISVDVVEPVEFIALHSKLLNITKVLLQNNEDAEVQLKATSEHAKYELFVLETCETIAKGQYSINLEFGGSLDNRIVGFYGSVYQDEARNLSRYIATSKFEPTFARQAFPCFDEPDMKAEYKIALVSPLGDGYTALSNMNVVSRVPDNAAGTMTTNFAVSRPMSTYLAVFIVSDFVSVSDVVRTNGVGDNFLLSVYSTPHQVGKLDFALETGVKVTEFYLNYFQIEYPLPKLDMAAIPDFVSGAMETWGLITYRETNLFYDPAVSSTINQQRVGNVIAHEIAHMWFGNLVTMKWWNDLWLNEGFASYIEYKGIDAAYSGWNMLDQFLIDDLHGVMNLDATLGSHPIVQKVENPDQITAIFDTITYSKGASVIRMLEDFVGPENFRTGVQNYLRKHAFKNAVTDDLLTELNLLNLGYDVDEVMSTWTKQKGLPVINVERIGQSSYRLTQKRFLADPDNEGKENDSDYNYRWYIPVTYISSADNVTVRREWFKNTDNWVEITVEPTAQWLKINNDQIGYYRVKYEYDMWFQLSKALETDIESMSTLNRAHLLNDAFSLAEAQQIQYEIPLTMTGYLKQEQEYVPWAVAASKLRSISTLLQNTPTQAKLKEYVKDLLANVYALVGWTLGESTHSRNLLRISVLDLACSMGLQSCLDESKRQFDAWLLNADTRPIPDLRTNVYNYGMATATTAQWQQVQTLFLAEQDAQEKVKLMTALGRTSDTALLTQYIQSGENRQTIRDQDYFTFIQSIAANPAGEPLVWAYVKQNWPALVQRFGLNERNLGRMIPSITGRFSTEAQLEDLKAFFVQYPEAGAGETARVQAIETIENNIKWLATNQKSVSDFLDTVVLP